MRLGIDSLALEMSTSPTLEKHDVSFTRELPITAQEETKKVQCLATCMAAPNAKTWMPLSHSKSSRLVIHPTSAQWRQFSSQNIVRNSTYSWVQEKEQWCLLPYTTTDDRTRRQPAIFLFAFLSYYLSGQIHFYWK